MFQDTISRRGMLIGSATVLFAGLPRLSLA